MVRQAWVNLLPAALCTWLSMQGWFGAKHPSKVSFPAFTIASAQGKATMLPKWMEYKTIFFSGTGTTFKKKHINAEQL